MQNYPNYLFSPQLLDQCSEDRAMTSLEGFEAEVNDYLSGLSPKKRDKALIDTLRYKMIRQVLMNPKDTSISTAQFRFWVKKMFHFSSRAQDIIYHDYKPVATREEIYGILVSAHQEANHGGRDKTSAIVKGQYSWIPKELVARFVRCCPTCKVKRIGCSFSSPFEYDVYAPEIYPPVLSESVESTPSPDPYYYLENLPEPCGIFETHDYLQESSSYLDDMLATYKMSIRPESLNPNDILENIMRDWSQQQQQQENNLFLSNNKEP